MPLADELPRAARDVVRATRMRGGDGVDRVALGTGEFDELAHGIVDGGPRGRGGDVPQHAHTGRDDGAERQPAGVGRGHDEQRLGAPREVGGGPVQARFREVRAAAQRAEDRADDTPDLLDLKAFRHRCAGRGEPPDGNGDEHWEVDGTLLGRPASCDGNRIRWARGPSGRRGRR
ncbi:hypothetical protein TPB0596_37640 [Tsukamurella pulmonis]|nr:hypothetical protein TPB0596_37640 [Tsukamurella pulmonis]